MKRLAALLTARVAIVTGIAVIAIALLIHIALLIIGATTTVPGFESVRDASGSDAVLLDRDGMALQRLRLDPHRRQLGWTPLDQVSPALVRTVVAAEDHRFWDHGGVDLLALGQATLDNLHRERLRGASTITMQLAGLLADEPLGRRSWSAKLRQLRITLALEAHWTKRQILEAYLNRLPFRGDLVGVDAAAFGLFGVGPSGLDDAQSAVLAALVRGPAASSARLEWRACQVLRALPARDEPDGCGAIGVVVALLPRHALPIPGQDEAPHLARRLLTKPGQRLTTTLDAGLQRFVREAVRTQLAALESRNVDDGAVVVLDNATGAVLAYVGSASIGDRAQTDAVAARRQPGSALKPFLYELAIEGRWLTAASALDDAPLSVATPSGNYEPQNYNHAYRGPVSVRTALASSLNVPAVRTLTRVGVDAFTDRLRALGLTTLTRDGSFYGAGLALGDGEVSLIDLTNAYRAIANGGRLTPVGFVPSTAEVASTQVMDPAACFVIADILADPAARAPTFGFDSVLSTHGWAAVKTGTSKGMRDNWAVGFTDRYTVGVWVGNASGQPMWDVSGTSGAAPIWQAVIEHLHADRIARAPAPPAGVEQALVRFSPSFEPARTEWFVAGTRTEQIALLPRDARPRIVNPRDGTILAIDPDIPASRQSLRIALAGAAPGQCARLDDSALRLCGHATRLVPVPAPGWHRIELRDADGTLIDSARIEVRGVPRPLLTRAATQSGGHALD